jgi:hypothetical protein
MSLDAGEITQARVDLEAELLPDEATIKRATLKRIAGGGRETTWNTLATVACSIAPVGGGEPASLHQAGTTGTAGDRIDDRTTHVLSVPAETDITEADRIEASGATYEVNLVRKRGAWELLRRVELKEAF